MFNPVLDLEKMPYDQFVDLIAGIDDDQAENSDIGGDSDPEDDLPLNVTSRRLARDDIEYQEDPATHDSPVPISRGISPILISPAPSPEVPTQRRGRGGRVVRTRGLVRARGLSRCTRDRRCGESLPNQSISNDLCEKSDNGGDSEPEDDLPLNIASRRLVRDDTQSNHDSMDVDPPLTESPVSISGGNSPTPISSAPSPAVPTQQRERGRVRIILFIEKLQNKLCDDQKYLHTLCLEVS